jgi:hypothetical protein
MTELVDRRRIVLEAREWVGTRWQHQAALKGIGTDCVGLLRGVALACGLIGQAAFDEVGSLNYGRTPFEGMLEETIGRFATAITEAEALPGDFAMMDFAGAPHHVAILGDYPDDNFSIIHAYAPARRVVETRLDDQLRARISGWYRFPGVA